MSNGKQILLLSFIAGFSVMVIELTAARIIAPIFGSSIYTWTSVIGVILLGTAMGSIVGGKLIDKKNDKGTLAQILLSASIFILFIPLIATTLSRFPLEKFPIWLTIMSASMLVFIIPAFFLGAISPAIYKQFIKSADKIGKDSSFISASWSIGSIVGTFLTGFVFVGYIGSTGTLLSISFLLFICSLWFCPITKTRYLFILVYLVLLMINFKITGSKQTNTGLLYNRESNYYTIRVKEASSSNNRIERFLYLDADTHSIESNSKNSLENYTNFYPVFSVFNKDIRKIVNVGGGALGFSDNLEKYYPNAQTTTVEIDPAVTAVAEKYFNVAPSVIKNTIEMDGRFFLANSKENYDIIFCDAYNSLIAVPWHLTTKEFFQQVKAKLSPNGAFAINFISPQAGEDAGLYSAMLATFNDVFKNNYVFSYGKVATSTQNIILLGLNSQEHPSHDEVLSEIKKLPNGNALALSFSEGENAKKINHKQGIILTDNFAPTDRLLLPIIDKYFSPYIKQLRSAL